MLLIIDNISPNFSERHSYVLLAPSITCHFMQQLKESSSNSLYCVSRKGIIDERKLRDKVPHAFKNYVDILTFLEDLQLVTPIKSDSACGHFAVPCVLQSYREADLSPSFGQHDKELLIDWHDQLPWPLAVSILAQLTFVYEGRTTLVSDMQAICTGSQFEWSIEMKPGQSLTYIKVK